MLYGISIDNFDDIIVCILRLDVRENPKSPWLLYNLKDDLGETTDVSANHPDLIAMFRMIQNAEHQNSHVDKWEFLDRQKVKK